MESPTHENTIYARLLLESNEYLSWTWVTIDTRITLTPETTPWITEITRDVIMEQHWFNHDIIAFTLDSSSSPSTSQLVEYTLYHSVIRQHTTLSGVLLMNKMHGRANRNKFWYRCIPNDKRIPSFLIAYAWNGMKHTQTTHPTHHTHQKKTRNTNFSKHPTNLFVVFKFKEWVSDQPHPRGELLETLGDVTSLNAFYEYQLYSRSLQTSIKEFVDATREALRNKDQSRLFQQFMEDYKIEDRTDEHIYSIDPPHCKDIDDAFHVSPLPSEDGWRVSIYIANVPLWLEMLGLWNAFSNRVATIYLPDRKRPMLPSKLSDDLCSLREGQDRLAFALDMTISATTAQVVSSSFHLCRIRVARNYQYASEELKTDSMYRMFHMVAGLLNDARPYLDRRVFTVGASPEKALEESHAVISFWMIQMNYLVAKTLETHETGLFRTASLQPSKSLHLPNLPETMLTFLQIWKSSGGSYVNYRDVKDMPLSHDLLKVDAYVHVTSPIRRLADLLNMIEVMRVLGLGFTHDTPAVAFYERWTSQDRLEYMNTSMRAIRRVQQDCDLIAKCTRQPEIMDKIVEGYVFDGIIKTDGMYQYTVYFPASDLKLITRCVTSIKCDEYTSHPFRMYLFKCGETARQKIKVELLE